MSMVEAILPNTVMESLLDGSRLLEISTNCLRSQSDEASSANILLDLERRQF